MLQGTSGFDSATLFSDIQVQGFLQRSWLRLIGRSRSLPNLLSEQPALVRYRRGVQRLQSVPVTAIVGSVGSRHDFDAELRPLHRASGRRWRAIAAAYLAGRGLPPVELIRVGQRYYVRDGMHRVSVARALGIADIEALVEDAHSNTR
jgi:hypothetical protein